MKIAVIGLGQFGRALVRELHESRIEVIAVDSNLQMVEEVKDHATLAVCLDAKDEKELLAQGVHKVDVAVVGIGDDFEADLLVTVLLKRHGVPRVIARAAGDLHELILRNVGADAVFWPEREAATSLSRRLAMPSVQRFFDLAEGCSMVQVAAPASFHEKTPAELRIRQSHHLNLVAVSRHEAPARDGEPPVEVVRPMVEVDQKIRPGDQLYLVGMDADLKVFLAKLGAL
ncbi:MAG: TrkA family potassium uptake protein [Planctomycetes bacterium]|nr:TrkA family potassium uptake protein [Planctomycetota bacterium]